MYRVEVHPQGHNQGSFAKEVESLQEIRDFCKLVGNDGDIVHLWDLSKEIIEDWTSGYGSAHKVLVIGE